MNPNNRQRALALAGTIIFHAAIVAILLLTWLMPPSLDARDKKEFDPLEEGEILLGSEYVIAGDVDALANNDVKPADATSDADAASTVQAVNNAAAAHDRTTQGVEGASTPLVSSKQPSAMKTNTGNPPVNPGTTKNTEPEKKPQQQISQQTASTISNRTSFGKKGETETGNTGSPTGNASSGAVSGTIGGQLAGRTVAHWDYPAYRPKVGKITVRVSVDSSGKVTSARYLSGSGAANADEKIRQSCVQAALRSRFSVTEGSRPQSGTITYNIR